jgi:hypothetical protein
MTFTYVTGPGGVAAGLPILSDSGGRRREQDMSDFVDG